MQQATYMVGGAKFQQAIFEWSKQSLSVFAYVFLAALLIFTVYADRLPANIRYQLSTTLGRSLSLLVLFLVYETAGWITALLLTIGIALVWFNRPLAYSPPMKEGFEGGIKQSVNQTGFRWFVERVLGENPVVVQEDRIAIGDVQEDNVEGNSRTSR